MKGESDKRRDVNRNDNNDGVDRKREARSDWKYDSNRHKRNRNKDARYRYYYGGYWYLEPYWTGPVNSRVSCGEGRAIINDSGFNRVRTIECSGRNYTYAARRNGDNVPRRAEFAHRRDRQRPADVSQSVRESGARDIPGAAFVCLFLGAEERPHIVRQHGLGGAVGRLVLVENGLEGRAILRVAFLPLFRIGGIHVIDGRPVGPGDRVVRLAHGNRATCRHSCRNPPGRHRASPNPDRNWSSSTCAAWPCAC